MAEALALDLLSKHLHTTQIVLTIGYDMESLVREDIRCLYDGSITTDHYGRQVPLHAHGSHNLHLPTNSAHHITEAAMQLYERIINPILLVRRINITAANVTSESDGMHRAKGGAVQLDLFYDLPEQNNPSIPQDEQDTKERRLMEASLAIRKRYGKNALLKGVNFDEGATGRERNSQIGGHRK
jgi:DNA polymerase V